MWNLEALQRNFNITSRKGDAKRMNTIRNVFRSLFEPIQVEARFPLMAWVLLLLAVIIATISKIKIICQ